MPVDQEKLAKLHKLSAANKVGGTRRKINKKGNLYNNNDKDNTKLQAELHKLHPMTIENVAEANFFKKNGKVLHFNSAVVQIAPQCNLTMIHGQPKENTLNGLYPSVASQLGSQELEYLTGLAHNLENEQTVLDQLGDRCSETKRQVMNS
ncbi:BAH_G0010780.mRNA.1.CDS.1 [Saccharomyces cerevisiae]|nr:HN1_G0045860.mRNA.1.CDS.1 [Saccharomyces cerevisiae]CAD6612107.1 SX2_G0045970.mRNA.1.CDS.1 [Saccharomyces cerevisiae]CAI4346574.1 BAL_1a_G0010810.mRNA.1.CDS.1 [Saccharomyces cerevisiae]CAI4348630.1 BAH_G0010780.mRNA.1.CDS.1 [Saccharomyces cerevisiae]CAI4352435.1 BAG_1a_G0010920.mRNA.1.CDS.1 [Saccharomyces cerevisiae]